METPTPPRKPGMPKGRSGNPGGQTKAQVAMRKLASQLISDATDQGRSIIAFAVNVLNGAKDESGEVWTQKSRTWAAGFLADRLWGKVTQTVEISNADADVALPDVRDLTLDELRRVAAGEDACSPADAH